MTRTMTSEFPNHIAQAKTEVQAALDLVIDNERTFAELHRVIATLEFLQGGSYLETLRRLENEQATKRMIARGRTYDEVAADLWDGNGRD